MVKLLPKIPGSYFILYLDNYFTSLSLFRKLRNIKIGACGTTRPNIEELPALFTILKKKFAKSCEWGTLFAVILSTDVLALAWYDNNVVLALSTVHTIHRVKDQILRIRKRPAETSTNAKNARKPFGNQSQKELEIPLYIDDYNHNMNGVDLANQLRQAYEIQRIGYRTWLPLCEGKPGVYSTIWYLCYRTTA